MGLASLRREQPTAEEAAAAIREVLARLDALPEAEEPDEELSRRLVAGAADVVRTAWDSDDEDEWDPTETRTRNFADADGATWS